MDKEASEHGDSGTAPAALGDLAGPWQLVEAVHDWQMAWCRWWPNLFLMQVYPPHPHEPPGQLEIPDPIEATGEHGLFA